MTNPALSAQQMVGQETSPRASQPAPHGRVTPSQTYQVQLASFPVGVGPSLASSGAPPCVGLASCRAGGGQLDRHNSYTLALSATKEPCSYSQHMAVTNASVALHLPLFQPWFQVLGSDQRRNMLVTNSSCAHPTAGLGAGRALGPSLAQGQKVGYQSDFYFGKPTQINPLCSPTRATCTGAPMG